MTSFNFAAIDIGNSRIKLLVGGETQAFDLTNSWQDDFRKLLKSLKFQGIFAVSSVNNAAYLQLCSIIEEFENLILLDIEEILGESNIIDFSRIKGLGIDRRLGMAGALAYSAPPYITVDCGTAVTVNAVDEGNICVGGAIFPGLFTQLRALHEFTSALPYPVYRYPENASGRDTETAILSGVLHSVAGGITQLVRNIELQEFAGISVPVYVTGGYADEIFPFLKGHLFPLILNKSLVTEGILYVMDKCENMKRRK